MNKELIYDGLYNTAAAFIGTDNLKKIKNKKKFGVSKFICNFAPKTKII